METRRHLPVMMIIIFMVTPVVICDTMISTLGVSVIQWAIEIWNIISTGGPSSSEIWWCPGVRKFMTIFFQKSAIELLSVCKSLRRTDHYALIRMDYDIRKLDSGFSNILGGAIGVFWAARTEINMFYKEFESAIQEKDFDAQQLCGWAMGIVRDELVTTLVERIYDGLKLEHKDNDLMGAFMDHFELEEVDSPVCHREYSSWDRLKAIYDLIVVTEMKAYLLEVYAHHLLYAYNGEGSCVYRYDSSINQVRRLHQRLRTHIKSYSMMMNQAMMDTSREFQLCSDDSFIRGKRHDVTCNAMNGDKGLPMYCSKRWNTCSSPIRSPCFGRITDCKEIPGIVSACAAKQSPQRYEWIHTAPSDEDTCESGLVYQLKEPCFCTCIDNDVESRSTHIFNLQPVEADVHNNMAVTGVRFIVQNGIMQFQIEQALVTRDGRITGQPEWKPIVDISADIDAARRKKTLRGQSPQVVPEIDYLIIEQNIAIHFDELAVRVNQLLTGVKFHYNNAERAVHIGILSRPFDAKSGNYTVVDNPIIILPTSRERRVMDFHSQMGDQRQLINHIKTLDNSALITSSGEDTWGQKTLPYFDARPISFNPRTALGGLGIFHEHVGNITGTIRIKLVSMNHFSFMMITLKDNDFDAEI
ncbi:uncharacterized protein LOC135165317 isoform X2 [Diachasmimorpha longicaudata]|uniref:uncharacterized protein LOC135165317 isoform X2 n=1 Tax=Diachasmimorpha longicaudata TaxID=58733 RepID=UPI0030B89A5B